MPLGPRDTTEPYLWLGLRCAARAPDHVSADLSWWTHPQATVVQVQFAFRGKRPLPSDDAAIERMIKGWPQQPEEGQRVAIAEAMRDRARELAEVVEVACEGRGCTDAALRVRDRARELARAGGWRVQRMVAAESGRWLVFGAVAGSDVTAVLSCDSSRAYSLTLDGHTLQASFACGHDLGDLWHGDYAEVEIDKTSNSHVYLLTRNGGPGLVVLDGDAVALQ